MEVFILRVEMNSDELLLKWSERVRRAQAAHYDSAVRCSRQHFWIGVPVVILTALIGTSVFVTLQKEAGFYVKLTVGLASVAAAVLAGVQTFLRFLERAESHRIAALRFGALRKEIEYMQAFPPEDSEQMKNIAKALLDRWNNINEEAPTANQKFYERHYKEGKPSVK
jgi:conflict system pore-forming effector with SLATT domain